MKGKDIINIVGYAHIILRKIGLFDSNYEKTVVAGIFYPEKRSELIKEIEEKLGPRCVTEEQCFEPSKENVLCAIIL